MHLTELLRSRVLSGPREAATLTRSSLRLEPMRVQRVTLVKNPAAEN
jgi:hypothetical protein